MKKLIIFLLLSILPILACQQKIDENSSYEEILMEMAKTKTELEKKLSIITTYMKYQLLKNVSIGHDNKEHSISWFKKWEDTGLITWVDREGEGFKNITPKKFKPLKSEKKYPEPIQNAKDEKFRRDILVLANRDFGDENSKEIELIREPSLLEKLKQLQAELGMNTGEFQADIKKDKLMNWLDENLEISGEEGFEFLKGVHLPEHITKAFNSDEMGAMNSDTNEIEEIFSKYVNQPELKNKKLKELFDKSRDTLLTLFKQSLHCHFLLFKKAKKNGDIDFSKYREEAKSLKQSILKVKWLSEDYLKSKNNEDRLIKALDSLISQTLELDKNNSDSALLLKVCIQHYLHLIQQRLKYQGFKERKIFNEAISKKYIINENEQLLIKILNLYITD